MLSNLTETNGQALTFSANRQLEQARRSIAWARLRSAATVVSKARFAHAIARDFLDSFAGLALHVRAALIEQANEARAIAQEADDILSDEGWGAR